MEVRELTCISCPLGCSLVVSIDGETIGVTGNTCKRGEEYARKEVLSPTRIVTSSVRVRGGASARASVKTMQDIPKDKIMDIMGEIRQVSLEAPVEIGDIIIQDCAGTGVSIVATRQVKKQG